ncbi:MAG: hypothetical protein BAJALOKI1v1_1300009 [Promethearchaeota archaeon]|nr:MAG: hypothetical protein BAJALOKI1v1_1300009 [Candidatus Lokiarchaeota archaeon]
MQNPEHDREDEMATEVKFLKPEKLLRPPRVFKLTNPRLRKIRRELRMLIRLAALDEYDRLRHMIKLYRYKERPPDKSGSEPANYIPPSQTRRRMHLGFKKLHLQHAFKYSICICANKGRWRDPDCAKGDRVRAYWLGGDTNTPGEITSEECVVSKEFYDTKQWESEVPLHFNKLNDSFMSWAKLNIAHYIEASKPLISWREDQKSAEREEFGKSPI